MKKFMIAAAGLSLLVACGEPREGGATPGVESSIDAGTSANSLRPGAAEIAVASELTPDDAALAAKYDRSCRACHSLPDAAAPLAGHKAAWDQRYEGKDTAALIASTKQGLNAMPAMGLCNDCSDEEFGALIEFMAGR